MPPPIFAFAVFDADLFQFAAIAAAMIDFLRRDAPPLMRCTGSAQPPAAARPPEHERHALR